MRGTFVIAIALQLGAPTTQMRPADLLAKSRTVFVEDVTVDRLPLIPALDALRAWKRFEVVSERERADLVLTYAIEDIAASLDLPTTSRDPAKVKRAYTLQVTDRASGQRIWRGRRDAGLSTGRTLQRLVEQFRDYVEKPKKRSL